MIIEFSEFNLKLLLFFVYHVFIIIEGFTNEAYIKDGKDNTIFITFRHFLCFIISGIFLLIFRFRTEKINKIRTKIYQRKILIPKYYVAMIGVMILTKNLFFLILYL